MENVKQIVVPVDFSKSTEKLVNYALYMGQELGAKLLLVHVVAVTSGDALFGMPLTREYRENFEKNARERMENLLGNVKERFAHCEGTVLVGDPVDEIVRFAEKESADLIIISTHGAKGWEKVLLGSVAERVVHHAHCPVLFMNPFKKTKR